ncbi:MAG: M20/M25/M40 family metallo-hydrolase [Holophagales bacterium]|nr:MAG: M20/M25/M40 family metallo-hydrolase [Holophagales bacterium]
MARRPLTPLGARRRHAARLALYLSLATSALVGVGLGRVASEVVRRAPEVDDDSAEWLGIDFAALPEVSLLQRYVAINTSYPDGDELAGARFLETELARRGIHGQVEYLGRGRANFWAILEGSEPGAVVLHHHIDVEEAHESADWAYAPFSGTIDGPWMYGRGVYDMKSLAIAQMVALFDLQADTPRPRKSVIYLATGGEETGSDLGMRWLVRQHPELVRRFDLMLTEGGAVDATTPTQIKYWGIEFGQKHFVDLHFCSSSRERLEDLRSDLLAYGKPDWPLHLSPEAREFALRYGASRDLGLYRQLLLRPDELLLEADRFAQLTPILKALFRNEIHASVVTAAPGGGWELLAKLHLFPGQPVAEGLAAALPSGIASGVSMTMRDPGGAHAVTSLSHPAYQVLEDAVRTAYPHAVVGPLFSSWTASDARFVRDLGRPAFGFSPFLIVSSDTYYVGGPNERISLAGYVKGVRLYSKVLRRLAN